MTNAQIKGLLGHVANWLNIVSGGCLIVGLFQPDHIFGGIIGAVICFLINLAVKYRSLE